MYKRGTDGPPAGDMTWEVQAMKYGVAEDDKYSLPGISTLEVQGMVLAVKFCSKRLSVSPTLRTSFSICSFR